MAKQKVFERVLEVLVADTKSGDERAGVAELNLGRGGCRTLHNLLGFPFLTAIRVGASFVFLPVGLKIGRWEETIHGS